jgi:hypothetical protein
MRFRCQGDAGTIKNAANIVNVDVALFVTTDSAGTSRKEINLFKKCICKRLCQVCHTNAGH